MVITVFELDLGDPGHVDAAVQIRTELTVESHPAGPHATPISVRRQLIGSELMPRRTFLASADGEPAGLLRMLFWDIEGSRDIAVCNLEVRASHRRQRVATTLLRRGVDCCVELDKPVVIGTGIASDETRGFWGAWLGLSCGLIERESQLDLATVDGALMQRWIDQRMDRAAGYQLRHVRGACPPELREAVAMLNTAMNDAPWDDLDLEPEIWTPAEVEAEDELRRRRGEERWTTIAFAPDGAPAALTAVLVNDDDPTMATQTNTVVLGPHRTRGLGRWLKADMWQRLRRDRPELQRLVVENAASNDSMLSINTAMGFVETARYADWQGETAVLAERLAR